MNELHLYHAVSDVRARVADGLTTSVAATLAARRHGCDQLTVFLLANTALCACQTARDITVKRRVSPPNTASM